MTVEAGVGEVQVRNANRLYGRTKAKAHATLSKTVTPAETVVPAVRARTIDGIMRTSRASRNQRQQGCGEVNAKKWCGGALELVVGN